MKWNIVRGLRSLLLLGGLASVLAPFAYGQDEAGGSHIIEAESDEEENEEEEDEEDDDGAWSISSLLFPETHLPSYSESSARFLTT